MVLRLLHLRLLPLLAVAALAVVASVEGQGSATNAWKPIIFSSPGTNAISSNPTSLSTQPAPASDLRGLFQDESPVSSFNDFAPGPAPMPRGGRRLQKSSGQSLEWEFMTSAEIMGVAPDQSAENQKRGMEDQQGSLTPMERYLEGQNPSAKMKAKAPDNLSPSQDFSGTENVPGSGDAFDPVKSGQGDLRPTMIFNPSASTAPDDNLFANPNVDSTWSKLFGAPASAPAQAPTPNAAQQQANMDQFMQLLNPGSTPAAATTASPGSPAVPQPQTALLGSDSTPPLFNPVGASFAPLSSGIGQAPSLTPLPTITRQANAQPVAPPAWAPQPAPWLSPTPQPFTVPQRKF